MNPPVRRKKNPGDKKKNRPLIDRLKLRAREMKSNIAAASLCLKDPRVPVAAKVVLAVTVAYALSPVDLIPDFIPVIGLLDDLVLVPLGIALAIKMIPPEIFRDNRRKAKRHPFKLKKNWLAASVIVLIWSVLIVAVFRAIIGLFSTAKQ